MPKIYSFPVEKINLQIVNWLKDYAKTANMKGFVVGISGGIDSAVTSTLCAQTGLKLLCVEMPIHQDPSHVKRAKEHIDQLKQRYENVSNIVIDLTHLFDTFKNDMPVHVDAVKMNLSLANSRARLRMTTLYYLAGIHGLLVTGTGNKIEDFGVGFFTKYGDGGVDISPIADLMKSEVYALGNFLNITATILNAAPTDGLFGDNRTDDQQLGATYDELEWAMQLDPADKTINYTDRENVVYKIYKQLNKDNQHKMNVIPFYKVNRD